MGNSEDRSLKKILRQVLKKVQGAGCDIDLSVANLLASNLPFGNASSKKSFLTFLEEIDQQGEFQSMEEAGNFLDLLGVIFWGVDLQASPQVEDGFTRIANEIMEALARIRIPGEARQPLDCILRKTYGFCQKDDDIPLSQFVLATGLSKVAVCKALKKLLSLNLITKKGNGFITRYRFQKNYLKWNPLPKKVTLPKKVIKGVNSLPKKVHSKESIKESIYVASSTELRLASLLLEEIQKNKSSIKEPNLQSWAKAVDLMVRRDGRTPERIEEVIRWCQSDTFWWKNVLSTLKLRKQFDRLEAEMASPKGKVQEKERQRVEYRDLTGIGGRA